MGILGMDEILERAMVGVYAVGYVEIWDAYSVEAVIEVAEELNSPIILGWGTIGVSQAWLNRWDIAEG